MNNQQKTFVVMTRAGSTEGAEALNAALERGWRVVHVAPMGGGGVDTSADAEVHFAALVVVERDAEAAETDAAEAALERVQEAEDAVGEIVEQLAEGDGAGLERGGPPNMRET